MHSRLHGERDTPSVSGLNFMKRKLVFPGKRFGRLVVICRHGTSKDHHITWLCICDCGREKIVISPLLKKNATKSCGCLARELASQRLVKHGMSKSPEYKVWRSMINRCSTNQSFVNKDYAGRGIKVCDEWMPPNGFNVFISDMGLRPSTGHSIDRINNDEGYYKGNCRWATNYVQKRNTSYNLWYEFNGIRMVVTDWEKKWGIPKNSIQAHIKRGKSFEEVYYFFEKKCKSKK